MNNQGILSSNFLSYAIVGLMLVLLGTHFAGLFKSSRLLKDKDIAFTCKVFSKEESTGYLGKDTVSAGYKPIQLNISNASNRYLKFSPNNLDIKTVPAEIAAESVYSNTARKIKGWGISSFFIPILLIPAIATSAASYKSNQKLKTKFIESAATDRVISPSSVFEGLIFVPVKDTSKSITVTLTDEHTQERIVCRANLKSF